MRDRNLVGWLGGLLILLVAILVSCSAQDAVATDVAQQGILATGSEPMAPTLNGAQLQLAHLAPFAMDPGTAVTITVNGFDVLTDVEFGDSTGYLPVPSGSAQVQIFVGASTTPAISTTVVLTTATKYTAIAVGGANGWPLDLKLLTDDDTPPPTGYAKVRVGQLAPFAAGLLDTFVDVRLQDGTILADDVPYGLIGGYTPLPAGTYDLKITSADGSTTLIDVMPMDLNSGDIVSLFAVGDGSNQPLGGFALPQGFPGALLPLAAGLQFAHLAPFAMAPGMALTITLNSTDVLTNVAFADSTGYLPVPAGNNQVQIFAGASATPAISVTVPLTHAMEFTALGVGGANMWPLELLLLTDDNSVPGSGYAKVRIGHLAPFAAGLGSLVDIRFQDGTLLPGFDDVPYGAIVPHIPLPVGTYDLKITLADGATELIDPFPFALVEGQVASLFVVGDGTNQPVGIFLLPSGAPGMLLPIVTATVYMPIICKMVP